MRNHRRAALAAAPLSLALLLAACSDDDDSADRTTTTTTTTEATTSSGSTPPPSSESATAAPPPSEPTPEATTAPSDAGSPLPTDTESWATGLVRAWGAGDRERAAELATAEVVDQLFGHADPGGDDWEPMGCDGAAGTLHCTFSSASRAETLVTRQANIPDEATGAIRPIGHVEITPDEVDDDVLGAQSDPLIRAWGSGDRAEATIYAHPDVVEALFAVHDPGGPDWDRRDCLVVNDEPQCVYYDPGRDQRLIVHFDPTALPTDVVVTDVEARDGASG